MSSFKKLQALHHEAELFILPNAWDARSAMMFEQNGSLAVGTSSAAVANSLGYEDGEHMSFIDYLFVIRRILSSIHVPLTVDIETGYGNTIDEIAYNVLALSELGVAGINIEDSVITDGNRTLKDPDAFAEIISYVKEKLHANRYELFINVRCDTYILNVANKEQETIRRLKIYNGASRKRMTLQMLLNICSCL
jgi:2-methylisocitrate lyase-like PEP mutase family enzyme